jgi:SapC
MTKQMLIYETVVAVSHSRHADASVEPSSSYAFAAAINAAPLLAAEFQRAAAEFAIVFTQVAGNVTPVVVLGVQGQQNLYLTDDAQWRAKYVPAFMRRYPFVFSASQDQQTLTLCIDETYPGFNREGRGQRLFGEDGKPSAYVEHVMKFLQEYQAQFERTRQFGRRLKELNLLEPMQLTVTIPAGTKQGLGGFLGVQRDRLRNLGGDTLASLARTDELELLYLHLHSLQNFNEVKDRYIGALASQPDVAPLRS